MDMGRNPAWVGAVTQLRRWVYRFWSWWSEELIAMLPAGLRAFLASGHQCLFLEISGDSVQTSRGSWTETIGAADEVYPLSRSQPINVPAGIRQVVLLLPRDSALEKTITLPLAAEENLREVLAFEMDRQTPFRADQVYYDCTVPAREPKNHTLTMDLVVTPRQALDELLAGLARIGLYPDVVTTRTRDARPLPVNLLSAESRKLRPLAARRVNFLLGGLTLALLTATVALPLLHKSHVITTLDHLLDTVSVQAAAAHRLSEEVEHLRASSRFLAEKKRSTPMVLFTLNELTRTLPDNTWLERLEITGTEVQLEGVSESAAALIPLLESSPSFQNAHFRSPVTRAPLANEERFHVSVQLQQEPVQ